MRVPCLPSPPPRGCVWVLCRVPGASLGHCDRMKKIKVYLPCRTAQIFPFLDFSLAVKFISLTQG